MNILLDPMERAAEEIVPIFNQLSADDKRALHVRLLAIGALHAGDIDFIEEVADEARSAVVEYLQRKTVYSGREKSDSI